MGEKIKKFKFEKISWQHVLAASIFPLAIYVYFCARNVSELSLVFILASSAVLFLGAVMAYFAVYLITRRCFTAMIFCLLCWDGCYLYGLERVRQLARRIWDTCNEIVWKFGVGYLDVYTLILLAVAMLLTALLCRFRKKDSVARFVFLVSLLLLAMNGTSIVFHFAKGLQNDTGKNGGEFALKTEFVKEDGLASPNIYWIHPDGMLGFDAFEKYYGDPQEELERTLVNRGFEVSRAARFEAAHQTALAVPILANPYAYDTWISRYMTNHKEAMKMSGIMNGNEMMLLRCNTELLAAFRAKGYVVNVGGLYGYWYPPEGGYSRTALYGLNKVWKREYGERGQALLLIQSQLNNIAGINGYFEKCCSAVIRMIGKRYGDVSEYRAYMPGDEVGEVILEAYQNADKRSYTYVLGLYDVLNGGYSSPRFTVVHNAIAHGPFYYNEDGSTHGASNDPLEYDSQHKYSGKVVVGMVDMIIEADPDAVIVIQADHGLHGNTEEDFIQAFGEDADAVEIWNSTISAVRIPEQYRNGEEAHMMDTPLNIARYLVNRFVGKNYEYLSGE